MKVRIAAVVLLIGTLLACSKNVWNGLDKRKERL